MQVCNNENKCFCDIDWSGPDCSIPTEHAEDMENYTSTEKPPNLNKGLMNKQEIIYGKTLMICLNINSISICSTVSFFL